MSNILNIEINNNGAGFFSCCSFKLFQIIKFINKYKKFPDIIDSKKLFFQYKSDENKNIDISSHFFEVKNDINIDFNKEIILSQDNQELQYSNYKLINFSELNPLICKYFSPSEKIKDSIKLMEEKYKINYPKLLTVYYRSTDKFLETNIPSLDIIINKINEILKIKPKLRILFVSDDLNAIKKVSSIFKNIIIIDELIKNYIRGYQHAIWFLSTVIIMSKTHSIITTSSNVANWIILYRNNSNKIYQFLSPKQFIYGVENKYYDPKKTNFWL